MARSGIGGADPETLSVSPSLPLAHLISLPRIGADADMRVKCHCQTNVQRPFPPAATGYVAHPKQRYYLKLRATQAPTIAWQRFPRLETGAKQEKTDHRLHL